MEVDVLAWVNLALRWFHVITGICWIGSSFYFIWLDNSLKHPENEKDVRDGVKGELWAVHGGGFYHKKKYGVAPSHMPEDLHWFKWEAYFTWISGVLLLGLIYYHGAEMMLIDRAKLDIAQWQAVALGVGFIGAGWLFYNELCKTQVGENNKLFGLVWFAFLILMGFLLNLFFTGRGAVIHIGAIVGTAMALNVFAIIIPNQKKVVASLLKGESPDPALGMKAKQRSTHNNYMTLPVLMIMISNHYPMIFGHPYNWAVLAGLSVSACLIRHFFNLKHRGVVNYFYPAAGVAAFVAVMIMAAVWSGRTSVADAQEVTVQEAHAIIRTHCTACHSAQPTHESVTEAPLGVAFDDIESVKTHAQRIYEQTVATHTMPLGNETGMTEEERGKLGAWIKGLEK